MEVLTQILKSLVLKGSYLLHPKCKNPQITSLMFADDLVVFSKPELSSIEAILSGLHTFYKITGLRINLEKFDILVAGVSQ